MPGSLFNQAFRSKPGRLATLSAPSVVGVACRCHSLALHPGLYMGLSGGPVTAWGPGSGSVQSTAPSSAAPARPLSPGAGSSRPSPAPTGVAPTFRVPRYGGGVTLRAWPPRLWGRGQAAPLRPQPSEAPPPPASFRTNPTARVPELIPNRESGNSAQKQPMDGWAGRGGTVGSSRLGI
ncbi:unnamed protein product [Eretmochelys imbricata]